MARRTRRVSLRGLWPDLRLSGLRCALRLLKVVAPLPRVPGEFPAHRPLAHPEHLADLGLGDACLSQGVNLAPVFVCDPTIRVHS